jgi:hypothetical protein
MSENEVTKEVCDLKHLMVDTRLQRVEKLLYLVLAAQIGSPIIVIIFLKVGLHVTG